MSKSGVLRSVTVYSSLNHLKVKDVSRQSIQTKKTTNFISLTTGD